MNSQETLVSIITVVYNGNKTLEQTIQSVINQSYTNIEYIIIDGGSTDGTIEIIKKYEDNISFWISEPDKGLYHAMNKGIEYSNGTIIGIINSDDWFEPDAVKIIVENYKNNPDKKIFHGDRYDVFEDGSKQIRKFHPSRIKFLYYGMTYNHPSMFVKREVYQEHLYNTEMKSLSDYEFVLYWYLRQPSWFYYLPISYVNYRLNGISANIKMVDSLKQGFKAKKLAGQNYIQNLISFGIRCAIFLFYKNLILKIKNRL